jgi:hypothetical protein
MGVNKEIIDERDSSDMMTEAEVMNTVMDKIERLINQTIRVYSGRVNLQDGSLFTKLRKLAWDRYGPVIMGNYIEKYKYFPKAKTPADRWKILAGKSAILVFQGSAFLEFLTDVKQLLSSWSHMEVSSTTSDSLGWAISSWWSPPTRSQLTKDEFTLYNWRSSQGNFEHLSFVRYAAEPTDLISEAILQPQGYLDYFSRSNDILAALLNSIDQPELVPHESIIDSPFFTRYRYLLDELQNVCNDQKNIFSYDKIPDLVVAELHIFNKKTGEDFTPAMLQSTLDQELQLANHQFGTSLSHHDVQQILDEKKMLSSSRSLLAKYLFTNDEAYLDSFNKKIGHDFSAKTIFVTAKEVEENTLKTELSYLEERYKEHLQEMKNEKFVVVYWIEGDSSYLTDLSIILKRAGLAYMSQQTALSSYVTDLSQVLNGTESAYTSPQAKIPIYAIVLPESCIPAPSRQGFREMKFPPTLLDIEKYGRLGEVWDNRSLVNTLKTVTFYDFGDKEMQLHFEQNDHIIPSPDAEAFISQYEDTIRYRQLQKRL